MPIARQTLLAGLRYVAVGAASVGVYLGVAAILHYGLSVPALIANVIGYLIATAANYVANYYWAFATSRPHGEALWRFLSLVGAGIVLNSAFVAIMLQLTPLPLEAIGFIFSICWPALSFLGLRYWAMR